MDPDTSILSSPLVRDHKPGGGWSTPIRSSVRSMRRDGLSYGQINKKTGLTRSTIQRMVKAKSSRSARKGKPIKKRALTTQQITRMIKWLSASWDNRRASYSEIKRQLNLNCSTSSICRALRAHGYHRCVACKRPFINKKQAEKRLAFCHKYRWWGTTDWKKVFWSDESTFETGKRGKIYVTRRPEEKNCQSCIQSVYRSGRVSVMVWGCIGWDFKSPLIFLEREEGRKGICSTAYLKQILEPYVFELWDSLTEEERLDHIFMEDGAKVHKGVARLARLEKGIRGFDWPPSSPDLNPIEKVWRWMKHEITKLEKVPTTIEEMKEVLQALWAEVQPEDWRYLTQRLTCKVEDVIEAKGMATVH
jgi:transposase